MPARQLKFDAVTLASQDRTHKRGAAQGCALVWATVFQQQRLIIDHQQQQVATGYFEHLPVAFVQINQAFKGHEHKWGPETKSD